MSDMKSELQKLRSFDHIFETYHDFWSSLMRKSDKTIKHVISNKTIKHVISNSIIWIDWLRIRWKSIIWLLFHHVNIDKSIAQISIIKKKTSLNFVVQIMFKRLFQELFLRTEIYYFLFYMYTHFFDIVVANSRTKQKIKSFYYNSINHVIVFSFISRNSNIFINII